MMIFLKVFGLGLWTAFAYAMRNEKGGLNAFGEMAAFSFFIAAPWLYLLPTLEAWKRGRENSTSIALVNILLGWSLIGWVVALVWALQGQSEKASPTEVTEESPERKTKTCPQCAEDVLIAAKKCKHCGSDLSIQ
jgi:ribosomal protein S27AE